MIMNSHSAPLLTRSELAVFAADVRAGGSPVILANGCFDLIHAGHIRYLVGAKELGGVLVVGINSDRQVRHLKGDGRPVLPEAERAEIVASFRCVDAVTIFDEPTVEQLIRALCPDIHAKGTDYTLDSVPEREIVIECGGRVAIVGDPKDHSSSEILKKIGVGKLRT